MPGEPRSQEVRKERLELPRPLGHRILRLLGLTHGCRFCVSGYTLQLVLAGIREREAAAGDEVLDRMRHEHLARPGERADPRPDVHGEAANVLAMEIHLTGVKAGPDLEPKDANSIDGCDGTADRPCVGRTWQRIRRTSCWRSRTTARSTSTTCIGSWVPGSCGPDTADDRQGLASDFGPSRIVPVRLPLADLSVSPVKQRL
jgi:hypothetical protein